MLLEGIGCLISLAHQLAMCILALLVQPTRIGVTLQLDVGSLARAGVEAIVLGPGMATISV